jgi:hypothetical protein
MHYTYVLQSKKDKNFYTCLTENLKLFNRVKRDLKENLKETV